MKLKGKIFNMEGKMRFLYKIIFLITLLTSVSSFADKCPSIDGGPKSKSGELRNNKDVKVKFFEDIKKGKTVSINDLKNKKVKLLGISTEDNFGRSSLMYTCIYNNVNSAKVVLGHFDDSEKAAFYIKEKGKTKKARDVFINLQDVIDGMTALMYCAQYNSTEIAKLILKDDYLRPELVDRNGRTALMYSAYFGATEVSKAIIEKYPESVSATDFFGKQAVFYAVQNNDNYDNIYMFMPKNGIDEVACTCSTRKVLKKLREDRGYCVR